MTMAKSVYNEEVKKRNADNAKKGRQPTAAERLEQAKARAKRKKLNRKKTGN